MQDIVGRKWHPILVYRLLDDGPLGFSALKERVDGISSKMLSESLDELQAEGLVSRKLLNDQPVRVEYSLTARGRSLEPLVTEMVQWGSEHAVEEATGDVDGSADVAQQGREW
nr:helix-turn-helix domain-containing protein [Halovenus rubra]